MSNEGTCQHAHVRVNESEVKKGPSARRTSLQDGSLQLAVQGFAAATARAGTGSLDSIPEVYHRNRTEKRHNYRWRQDYRDGPLGPVQGDEIDERYTQRLARTGSKYLRSPQVGRLTSCLRTLTRPWRRFATHASRRSRKGKRRSPGNRK